MKADAIRRCTETIEVHSKSFSAAARFLPPPIRVRAVVLYAWCRRADDLVDLASAREGAKALVQLRAELDSIYAGEPQQDSMLEAFQQVIQEGRIPRDYPEELIHGLQMDVEGVHYREMEQLLQYSWRVAGTVGLMMCHVMGVKTEKATRHATHLGIAMQITNICRDVATDWEMGRLYLPDSVLAPYGLANLHQQLGGPFPADARFQVSRAIADLLNEADRYYESGDRGMYALTWQCSMAIRTARHVYAAIGTKLRSMGCNPLAGRAIVPKPRKILLTGHALAQSAGEGPMRASARISSEPYKVFTPRHLVEFPHDILPVE